MLIDLESIGTQAIGRIGELIVEMELLAKGWQVGNFNASTANSAGWDVFAAGFGRSLKIRVKTKRPGTGCFRWSAKSDGSILAGLCEGDGSDIVAAVDLLSAEGEYAVYLVPSVAVEGELRGTYDRWVSAPKADGSPRKATSMRNLYIDGDVDRLSHGYAIKWAKYRDAWDGLKSMSDTP